MCDFTRSNLGGNTNQSRDTVGVHRETKNTIQRIAELTNESEAVIVDKAISEYLATEIQKLTDNHNSGNYLTVEYNGKVVYTSYFRYDIDSDELTEVVSDFVISQSVGDENDV